MNPLFYSLLVKQVNFHSLFAIFLLFHKLVQKIYFLRTGKMGENGQSFIRVAKPYWDQTVGSERAASAAKTSGLLSTGSSFGSLVLTFLKGLMYSQATVTTQTIE